MRKWENWEATTQHFLGSQRTPPDAQVKGIQITKPPETNSKPPPALFKAIFIPFTAGIGLGLSIRSQNPILAAADGDLHPRSTVLTVEAAGIASKLGPSWTTLVRGLVRHLVDLPVARVIASSERQQTQIPPGQREFLRNTGTGKAVTLPAGAHGGRN